MDGSFTSGLTYPLFIEIKNNLDGLVTFSTTDNSLSQQLELILAEPLYDESQHAADIKVEKMEEDDDSNIDVKDFLRYNKNITDNDDKKLNDNGNTKNNAISTTTTVTTTTTTTTNSTLPVTTTSDNVQKIYTCNNCSENFDTKEIYDIHMSGHANNMKCAICNMVLKSLKNYEKHCLRCKPYECQICGRIVRFRPNFIKHMRVHTGQQSERHKYKCEVCQKEFMSFEYFKVHKKIHNENVNLKCDVCGKVFSALASLRGHSKLHTGIKLHKCDICGKGFGQRYNLKIHSRVHTGEIPYECGICKRKLHTQSSYQNHMQTYHQKHKGSQTTSTIISDKTKTNEKIFKIKIKKDLKNDIKNSIDKNEIKIKVERETQTVVQNNDDKIRNNCIVIPTKLVTKSTTATKTTLSSLSSSSSSSVATATTTAASATATTTLPLSAATIVSDTTLSNDLYNTLIHNNETIKEGPVELCNNLIKYTTTNTDLLKLNSMNPKINQIIIKKNEINDNDDDDDDDNAVDNNVILGSKCTNKILINNTGDCNKFHNNYFENDFIIKTNKVDDDDLMLNHCLSYTNIFETNTISNSIITDGIYLKYENNHDDDDIDNDNCVNNLQSTTNTTDIGINSATTTDGNFIKKEWIYSNTTSNTNYSSITKFDVDDDDEFSEAASFVYD